MKEINSITIQSEACPMKSHKFMTFRHTENPLINLFSVNTERKVFF